MHKSLNQKSLNHKLLSVIGLNWVLEISILVKIAYHWYRLPIWIANTIESQVILNHAQVIESQVVDVICLDWVLENLYTSKNSLSQLISMPNSTSILFLII